MNKKYYNLINELQKTLDDPKVKNNQELTHILTSYKDKLENGEEYRLVCTKLTNDITTYVRYHNFKAPESVLKLYNDLANVAAQYRGFRSFITWF
ncbi:bacteriocin immunity protein [Clostridium taeniosporum]|uniref:Bacteriocin immunity protein n=1 Tax=Clostridium taeniosporum TaxID=394958 RepID=A0A1D7XNV2_9CLOT|nr:bacteriocin immunity protein [Clostridium taeniosporum]AOR25022.1 bacteriocin immunity protein [Clostridium taeniosporum]